MCNVLTSESAVVCSRTQQGITSESAVGSPIPKAPTLPFLGFLYAFPVSGHLQCGGSQLIRDSGVTQILDLLRPRRPGVGAAESGWEERGAQH